MTASRSILAIIRPLSIAFCFLTPCMGLAQADLSQKEVQELTALKKELEGSYQVQMLDPKAEPSLMLSVYEEIRSRRDDKKVVHYQVDDKTRIKILPKAEIQAKGFEGVKDRVVRIDEGRE